MLKKLVLAATFAFALLSSVTPASAFQSSYYVDSWGNHRLDIGNDSPYYLYCQIRGSNGTWGNATIPPWTSAWFYIYGASHSYWNCWH
ncbi:MAG: hypothetical protein VX730_03775 [Pseudomonadota bacterium]|nr:hypothetical protein [Pseudomonadota bacterium]